MVLVGCRIDWVVDEESLVLVVLVEGTMPAAENHKGCQDTHEEGNFVALQNQNVDWVEEGNNMETEAVAGTFEEAAGVVIVAAGESVVVVGLIDLAVKRPALVVYSEPAERTKMLLKDGRSK